MIFEVDKENKCVCIQGYAKPSGTTFATEEKRDVYLAEAIHHSDLPDESRGHFESYMLGKWLKQGNRQEEDTPVSVLASKYKPIALKTRPVVTGLPVLWRDFLRKEDHSMCRSY